MEDRPVRVAFCKILWGKTGGSFTSSGLPALISEDVPLARRGKCNTAFDCGECPFLHSWLQVLAAQGWAWGWECNECLSGTLRTDRESGIDRRVQGFYQSGRRDQDPDEMSKPSLEGCTRCGRESNFLQLVLRR